MKSRPRKILALLIPILSIFFSSAETMSCESEPHTFPDPERHELSLSSGRTLSYYTYGTLGEDAILYVNGFPGSGLESRVCAEYATSKAFVAMDRPGVGYTDPPLPGADDEDPFATCMSDVWELAKHLEWKTFSVVAVSGGGPHGLALLANYLSSSKNDNMPKLEKLALVGGSCVSAGTEGMLLAVQFLAFLVKWYNSSCVCRFLLGFVFSAAHYVLPFLPDSVASAVVSVSTRLVLPPIDSDLFQDNPPAVELMITKVLAAVRQGSAGPVLDARRVLTPAPATEKILREMYASDTQGELPQVTIYQGNTDVVVPLTHGDYMHKEIFGEKSKLVTYDGQGHVSLTFYKAATYVGGLDESKSSGKDVDSGNDAQSEASDDTESETEDDDCWVAIS